MSYLHSTRKLPVRTFSLPFWISLWVQTQNCGSIHPSRIQRILATTQCALCEEQVLKPKVRPVSKHPETHGLGSSTPESGDTDTADLAEQLSPLELAHSKLQSSLELAQVQISSLQAENINCKALFVRDHQFGLQLDDNTTEKYSRDLREHRTLDLREDPPFLKSVTALTLADDFDSRGL